TIQSLLTIGEKYPDFQSQIFVNAWRDFSHTMLFDKDLWIISFATALISILETLLSGQIAAKMSKTPFDRSREMRSLGLANIGSGLLGGIPATAALARTALNIKSGGNHQTSGVLNALFTLIICVFAFTLFRWLPMVTVASILVMVAIGMVNKNYFTEFARNGRNAITLMLLVAAITFIIDPISGILIGSFIALLIFVEKNSTGQTEILLWNKGKMTEALMKRDFLDRSKIHSDLVVYKISGTLTYINMPAHLEAVKKIKDNEHVIISLRHAFYADHDGVDYLRELISILENQNKEVILCGINSEIKKWIQDETFYKERGRKKQIFKRTSEAIYQLYKE
ncbi:MAG: SulP family inorganic anion transporter, partial [Candidatus Gracilibacteria bacterium]|nr:SulP family inorganic anion transporter [Candidatus Gracilibacteria bacterium]